MNDIAPKLLKRIQDEFAKAFNSDKTVSAIYKKTKDGAITYADANDFSIRAGEILSDAFNKYISEDTLPEGRMWYNIADKIMQPTLENNYDLITGICEYAQKTVNDESGVGMNYVKPALNQNKIDGFINKLSNSERYDEVQWLLKEPVVNFSQAVVDDSIKANASFHAKSGLSPKIVRKLDNAETRTVTRGKSKIRYKVPCKWCEALAGTWNYLDMPDFIADNIFRRHENCRCTVEYISDGKRQDVWSKKYIDEKEQAKEERIERLQTIQRNLNNRNEIYTTLKNDLGFDLVDKSSLDRMNIDLLKNNTNQLLSLEDRFGVIHLSTGSIEMVSSNKSLAYISNYLTEPLKQNFCLSRNYYAQTYDWFINQEKNMVTSFFSMPCKLDDATLSIYTVTHEYGHMLQNKLINDYLTTLGWTPDTARQFIDFSKSTTKAQYKFYYKAVENVQNQCFSEIIEIAKQNNPEFKLSENLSKYGRTNKAEFFAEVFANAMLGEPNELGNAMNIWLEGKGL